MSGRNVVVVGGANSAGQAALFLCRHAEHVHVLIRRDDLRDTMSNYLAQRLLHDERVTVHPRSELCGVHGTKRLSALTWRDHRLGRDVAEALRSAARCHILRTMRVIDFELERRINASINDVFVRLSDIEGHNDWMPQKGSILRHTKQTSPGPPSLGTTFIDETRFGPTPGEIVEFDVPHLLTYHWWDSFKSGRVKAEGWPSYSLETVDDGTTLVRHHAKMHTYGIYRLATPVLRRIAVRERTATVDALKASFESNP